MKDLLEILTKIWALFSNAAWWLKAVVVVGMILVVLEIGQDGFLGSPAFWAAARVAPWPQMLEPNRVITASYEVLAPKAKKAEDADGKACPVGSKINLKYARSSDGWVAVAGWNAREGFYSVSKDGRAAQPTEKEKIYEVPFEITSSAGAEYFIVLGSSKPFDSSRYLDLVADQLKTISKAGKGGVPQLRKVDLGSIEAGRLGSCVS